LHSQIFLSSQLEQSNLENVIICASMIALKIIVSLVSLLAGLLVLYSSAYAFSANNILIGIVRLAVIVLTILGIGLIWRNQWVGSMASMGGVVLMLGVISTISR
jgi:hypothetical protein